MMLSEEENNRLEQLFCRLAKSKFRSRFKLMEKEREYLQDKGLLVIEKYARVFIMERLAPALPKNDGKQTPMKNHPVFIDQHSTATCCRKCLGKWHRIERDKKLTTQQIDYVVSVIMYWLRISTTCSDSSKLKYSIYYFVQKILKKLNFWPKIRVFFAFILKFLGCGDKIETWFYSLLFQNILQNTSLNVNRKGPTIKAGPLDQILCLDIRTLILR